MEYGSTEDPGEAEDVIQPPTGKQHKPSPDLPKGIRAFCLRIRRVFKQKVGSVAEWLGGGL